MELHPAHVRFLTELAVLFGRDEKAEALHRISTVHPSFLVPLLMHCIASQEYLSPSGDVCTFLYGPLLARVDEICGANEPF